MGVEIAVCAMAVFMLWLVYTDMAREWLAPALAYVITMPATAGASWVVLYRLGMEPRTPVLIAFALSFIIPTIVIRAGLSLSGNSPGTFTKVCWGISLVIWAFIAWVFLRPR